MRFLIDNVDNDDMEPTPAQTERSREHPSDPDVLQSELGRSQELENEDSGDIADEGSGRRG
jgi:hypothetical protein